MKTNQQIINDLLLFPENSIEISKRDSIFKHTIKPPLRFTTDLDSEDLLIKEAYLYLDKLSIFRKFNPLFAKKQEFINTKNYIVYDERQLKIINSNTEVCNIKPPTHSITYSIKYDNTKLNKLSLYGKKIGGILASYENKIFFKSLNLFSNIEMFNCPFELESLCKSFFSLKKKGIKNFNIILPESYEKEASIYLKEMQDELNISSISPTYIHDMVLKLQRINAVILNKDTNLIIRQPSSIRIAGVYVNREFYLQTSIKIGYAVSGLTTSAIYGYNNVNQNFI